MGRAHKVQYTNPGLAICRFRGLEKLPWRLQDKVVGFRVWGLGFKV